MNENAALEPTSVADVATAASPGIALGAARRAQNISIEDAARQLRLSVSQVQAIESDAHDKLPGPVFVRGFIRNYARLLRMDADALLKDTGMITPVQPQRVAVSLSGGVPFPQTRKHHRLPYFAMAALALVAALAWYEFRWPHRPDDGKPDVQAAVKQDGPIPSAAANPVVAAPEAAEQAPAPAAKTESILQFTFAAPSWVNVRDGSGVTLVAQTQPAGNSRTFKGTPPFDLVIGNAQAVGLIYNGAVVDLAPHVYNTVARLKLE